MTNLEAAVAQNPTDTMTLQVWADSLISAGDPLGEYLSLSIHQTATGFLDAGDNVHGSARCAVVIHFDTQYCPAAANAKPPPGNGTSPSCCRKSPFEGWRS